jgi:hypothetical protein
MSDRVVVVRCLTGDYINAKSVYRWFVTQNATKGGWDVMASIQGPQHPYTVVRCTTEDLAHTSLTNLLETLAVLIIKPEPAPILDLPVTGERGAVEP